MNLRLLASASLLALFSLSACDSSSDDDNGTTSSNNSTSSTSTTSSNTNSSSNTSGNSNSSSTTSHSGSTSDSQSTDDTSTSTTSTSGTSTPTETETTTPTDSQTGTDTGTSTETDPDSCVPGTTFPSSDGCNTCTCPESGKKEEGVCTEKACVECEDSSQCQKNEFCNFPGEMCGAFDTKGVCATRPTICDQGGEGACDCAGKYYLNDCLAQSAGVDVNRFGGCSHTGDAGSTVCGDKLCDDGEFCSIAFNDVLGEDQPEFYSNCNPFPETCSAQDCSCFEQNTFDSCVETGEFVMRFLAGG